MLEEKVNGKVYYLNKRLVLTEAMHDVKEMYLFASEVKSEKDDNNHRSYEFMIGLIDVLNL